MSSIFTKDTVLCVLLWGIPCASRIYDWQSYLSVLPEKTSRTSGWVQPVRCCIMHWNIVRVCLSLCGLLRFIFINGLLEYFLPLVYETTENSRRLFSNVSWRWWWWWCCCSWLDVVFVLIIPPIVTVSLWWSLSRRWQLIIVGQLLRLLLVCKSILRSLFLCVWNIYRKGLLWLIDVLHKHSPYLFNSRYH